MKTKLATAVILIAFILTCIQVQAEEQTRKVDPFTEISLRIGAKVYLEQGEKQNLEIVAKPSTLEEIITEVKDGKLIIRFPNKNFFWSTFQPGDITIHITTPEINGLAVSGSGDIIAENQINTKVMDMAVSGSGNIKLSDLSADQVKTAISGSGNIVLAGTKAAQDLSVNISGSGNFKGLDFSADDVAIKVSGSGNVVVQANNNLYVRLAGSGNVTYKGRPLIDQSIAGSGKVRSAK
ncbi:MAG: head GIN domain-containing protein [Bacteroidota bacterium]|nr:head GIN domain-containing protein [Bacteroidota bacterium]